MIRRATLALCLLTTGLLPTACSESAESDAPPAAIPELVTIDFGVLRHGAVVTRDLEIPLPQDGGVWFPVGFQRACTCATHRFVAVDRKGDERVIEGAASADHALRAGERLMLRLTVDTNEKEPADLPPTPTPGQVTLQDCGGGFRQAFQRVMFTFGVDSPITVRPYAHLNVGDVPRGISYRQTLQLVPDGQDVEFGPVRVEEPVGTEFREVTDVTARLESTADRKLVHVSVTPSALRPEGPFAAYVVVGTDLERDGTEDRYELRIPVSGRVVPEIQLSPPERFAFGKIDFAAPYEQRLVVTDHDLSRTPEFVVVGILDHEGHDLREHFSLRIDPLESRPRSRVLTLGYDGRLTQKWVRGRVLLAKTADTPAVLEIELSAFARN